LSALFEDPRRTAGLCVGDADEKLRTLFAVHSGSPESAYAMQLSKIYGGRRVLVTGHSGFKGAWLCTWLDQLGAKVSGLSLAPSTTANLYDAINIPSIVASHMRDIRDMAAVEAVLADERPEIVFHLAAQPLVRRSYVDPVETFSTNVMGTANLLEACRRNKGVKAIVVVTTDKVYANEEWVWPYRETDRLGGADPYSASKACAELVTQVYRDNLCKFEPTIAIATARGGNVVGGGDWSEDRLIPDIIRAVYEGRKLVLRNPMAVRPWQHVLELCEGYMELGARLLSEGSAMAEAWNFGPDVGGEVNVGDLANLFLKILGRETHALEIQSADVRLKESKLLRLDISKSVSRLNWRPRLSTHETLEWTAQWYAAFAADQSAARQLTLGQLATFESRRARAGQAL
jgi:CDP-glucose 4,6-dehydratase